MDLKPGDLVLVKINAFQGKRKIKDRWEDKPHKVVFQIMTDITSYEETDQCRQSHVLHHNWILLIAPETGVPLCVGVHQVWDRCTSPTPVKPTPRGVTARLYHKKIVVWQSPSIRPGRLPWGGSMGSYDFSHGHPLEHPLSIGEDFR